MTADIQTFGFPAGYFVVRNVATNRLLDIQNDEVEDSTEIILWLEKEYSLVESLRNPESNNQVFFIDTSGALCSRSSGHAIDVEDDRLVLRHRRPVSYPFPNKYSHPLPRFSYDAATGEISVLFASDPSYPLQDPTTARPISWQNKSHILTSIPMRKPRTIIDDASDFISSAIATPLSFLSGGSPPKATPEEVFNSGIDLNEDEVLEHERGEEAEVDDSQEAIRRVKVLAIANEDKTLIEKAKARRRWEVTPLRKSTKRTDGARYQELKKT
jgi:WD repeat-containing protein 23